MRRLIWTAYLVMAAEGFIVYAVGFITPYVQSSLGVAPWLAQLPNSLMAIGMLLGGTIARGLNARYGADRTIRLWILGFVLSTHPVVDVAVNALDVPLVQLAKRLWIGAGQFDQQFVRFGPRHRASSVPDP